MTHLIGIDDASTPLTYEEMADLKLSYITNRNDLNEAEQANILEAQNWAFKRTRQVLDEKFLKNLHHRMFSDVWKWAGLYRKTPRNIGIDAYRISLEINVMIEDVQFWIASATYPLEEIAARFHHRLVLIHPFPNGNGRFSRLATDLLLKKSEHPFFLWGSNLECTSQRRKDYIAALQSADLHDIQPLLNFVMA